MNLLSALWLVARSSYVLCRVHEFRRPQVLRDGLWPHVTLAWWTWDPLPEMAGRRIAELADTLRMPPAPGGPTLF